MTWINRSLAVLIGLAACKSSESASKPVVDMVPIGDYVANVRCLHVAGACEQGGGRPSYAMDRREITNAQWHACVMAGRCEERRDVDPDAPVTGIAWKDAQGYCEWRDASLPTSEEWETAARAMDGRRYPWGNDPPTCERAILQGCGDAPAHGDRPAGASVTGIEDLVGNVAELLHPGGRSDDPGDTWEVAGGSFRDAATTSSYAGTRTIGAPADDVGFRCVDLAREKAVDAVAPQVRAASRARKPVATAAVRIEATYLDEHRKHSYEGDLLTVLERAGVAFADDGAVKVDGRCVEQAHGEYREMSSNSQTLVGYEITCDLTVTAPGGSAAIRIHATPSLSPGGGARELYEGVIDDIERAPGWRTLGAVIALLAGDRNAAPELARMAVDPSGRGFDRELGRLALTARDTLDPVLLSRALVATDAIDEALALGEVSGPALGTWAYHGGRARPDLARDLTLLDAGPIGQRTVATLLEHAYTDDKQRAKWVAALRDRGNTPEILDLVRRWLKWKPTDALRAAEQAIAARLTP